MKKLALAVVVLIAFAAAPSAGAANLVPNGDFSSCPGSLTSWSPDFIGDTATCASIAGHTTVMQTTTAVFNGGANAACVNSAIPAGTIPASYSYYVANATGLTALGFGAVFYSEPGCTGSSLGQGIFAPDPIVTGAWTSVNGSFTGIPAGTDSVMFFVTLQCTVTMGSACTNTVGAYFDDLVFDPAATPVTFRSLSATRSRAGVRLRWHTESELGTLGFHVYREVNGRRVRVSPTLVAAKGRGAYSFLDRRAPRGKAFRYWIQEIAADGSRTWYGPVRVRA